MGTLAGHAASSAAQRQWRTLGAPSFSAARGHIIGIFRQQLGFAAAIAHARLLLSRLELIRALGRAHSGRVAGRHAHTAAAAMLSPTVWEAHGPRGAR